jgi:hypothetical protein
MDFTMYYVDKVALSVLLRITYILNVVETFKSK